LISSPYFCSLCNKESSRKNNALRHNRLVHDEQGEIHDRSNNTLYSPQIPREPYPGYPTSKDIVGSVGSNVFQNNGKKLNGTNTYNPQPILKKAKNSMDVKIGQDLLFYEVGKIGYLNEVLEDMLSNYPQGTKKRVSEMMISCALASQDPKQNYLENLSWCRNMIYSDRFAECISSFCNVPKASANEILRNSILRKYRDRTD
jgi:hypothetical protein